MTKKKERGNNYDLNEMFGVELAKFVGIIKCFCNSIIEKAA